MFFLAGFKLKKGKSKKKKTIFAFSYPLDSQMGRVYGSTETMAGERVLGRWGCAGGMPVTSNDFFSSYFCV